MTSNGNASWAPAAALLLQVRQSLMEAGFALHDCTGPGRVLGGVSLTPATPGVHPEGEGVIVTWAQHDRLAGDETRYLIYQAIQDELNAVLGIVLELLGYHVHPFGQGGANLVVGRADPASPNNPGSSWLPRKPGSSQDGQA